MGTTFKSGGGTGTGAFRDGADGDRVGMVNATGDAVQSVSFSVRSWAGWLPGRADLAMGGEIVAAAQPPAGLRRRATPLGRKVLEAAWPLLAGRTDQPRIVLASRHGEYERTWGLAQALAAEGELSPADFSLSIHHGLAALLSIATGNRAGHTALAGGGDSFGFGCVEAAISLAEGDQAVLLLYYDDPLPERYRPIAGKDGDAAVLALLLEPAGQGGDTVTVEFQPTEGGGGEPLAQRFGALLAGEAAEAAGEGERMSWRWRRVA